MCLAIPMKVKSIDGDIAKVEVGGTEYQANLNLIDNVKIGDYVIVHAGFAIEKLDEEAALESLEIWREIANYSEERR
jgi:hydrogenase expression/formation protein HypC